MSVILFNCVTLGMYQPCEDNECDNKRCKILKVHIKKLISLSNVSEKK